MAEATVTWKLSPNEARLIRDSLESYKDDLHELAREVRGEDPRQAREHTATEAQLALILERI